MVEDVYGDGVSCCSTTFWKLLLNDWNFTPHMARPRQSVELGGFPLSEWSSIPLEILNDDQSHLERKQKIVAMNKYSCNHPIEQFDSANDDDWCHMQYWFINIQQINLRKLSNGRALCSVEVVQSGQKIKWDLAPPIWHGYEARRTICALQPDNTKQMERCCNTDGRRIMFIWDLGSWIWLLGVKTLSRMDVAPCC